MPQIRRQLTLFLQGPTTVIEQVRATYNPVQSSLIAAHVTLCREDEIVDIGTVRQNIRQLHLQAPLEIRFGPLQRFDGGKGLMLPALAGNPGFEALRGAVLQDVVAQPRAQQPHITLIHPRNGTCTDQVFAEISAMPLPLSWKFDTISLIAQLEGGVWHTREEFLFAH